MQQIIKYLPTLIVVISGAVYAYLNQSVFAPLYSINLVHILSLAGIVFAFFIATGYTFYLLVGFLSVRLSLIETIGLTFLTNFGNYLGPTRPGAAIKAIYLKSQKGMLYASFSAVLATNSFLVFFASGVTGLLLLASLWLQTGVFSLSLVIICIALILVSLLPLVFRFRQIQREGRIWSMLNNAIAGIEVIKSQKLKLLMVCGTILIQYLISAWVLIVAYHALGHPIPLTLALIIGIFTSISNFFTITPNNLGIQEVVMAYLYTITGMDFTSGLMGAGLIRAIHIILTFGLTPIFTHFMLKSANISLSSILPNIKKTV